MNKTKYPLATTTWDDAEYSAMQEVIKSGNFSMGRKVQQFETDFSRYVGSRYAVMVNSGSSANLLMVAALFYLKCGSLKPGDEVIVPAVSWSTTYYPLHQYGLVLRFVDIDLETLNYDLSALEASITNQTKAIMVVNLLGNSNDFSKIDKLIAGRDIKLIEDNCESLGAEFNGKMAGTFGLMGTFSTYFSHHISTMEGGVVVTDNEELYHILLALRSHGWTRHLPEQNLVTGRKNPDPFVESFNFVLPGYNVRPLELSGAIGIEQLKKLPKLLKARKENSEYIFEYLGGNEHIMLQKQVGTSSWFGFSLVIRKTSSLTFPDLRALLADIGVETRPIVSGNFLRNPVCKFFNSTVAGDVPNAEWIHSNGLFIGNQHYSIEKMFKSIADAIAHH